MFVTDFNRTKIATCIPGYTIKIYRDIKCLHILILKSLNESFCSTFILVNYDDYNQYGKLYLKLTKNYNCKVFYQLYKILLSREHT